MIKSDSRVGCSNLASTESRWGAGLTLTIDAPVRPFSLQNLMRGSELPARAQPVIRERHRAGGPQRSGSRDGHHSDAFPSPMHSSIPRFFVDASDLATLLNGRIRRDVPTVLEILLVWVLALAGATVFLRRSPGTGFLIWAMGWGGLAAFVLATVCRRDGPSALRAPPSPGGLYSQ